MEDEQVVTEGVEMMHVNDTNSMNNMLLNQYQKKRAAGEQQEDEKKDQKKRKKSSKNSITPAERPSQRYADLGGIESVLKV